MTSSDRLSFWHVNFNKMLNSRGKWCNGTLSILLYVSVYARVAEDVSTSAQHCSISSSLHTEGTAEHTRSVALGYLWIENRLIVHSSNRVEHRIRLLINPVTGLSFPIDCKNPLANLNYWLNNSFSGHAPLHSLWCLVDCIEMAVTTT